MTAIKILMFIVVLSSIFSLTRDMFHSKKAQECGIMLVTQSFYPCSWCFVCWSPVVCPQKEIFDHN